ncbi:hypothetical protein EJB05_36779, partial [Eragrostis curvula]
RLEGGGKSLNRPSFHDSRLKPASHLFSPTLPTHTTAEIAAAGQNLPPSRASSSPAKVRIPPVARSPPLVFYLHRRPEPYLLLLLACRPGPRRQPGRDVKEDSGSKEARWISGDVEEAVGADLVGGVEALWRGASANRVLWLGDGRRGAASSSSGGGGALPRREAVALEEASSVARQRSSRSGGDDEHRGLNSIYSGEPWVAVAADRTCRTTDRYSSKLLTNMAPKNSKLRKGVDDSENKELTSNSRGALAEKKGGKRKQSLAEKKGGKPKEELAEKKAGKLKEDIENGDNEDMGQRNQKKKKKKEKMVEKKAGKLKEDIENGDNEDMGQRNQKKKKKKEKMVEKKAGKLKEHTENGDNEDMGQKNQKKKKEKKGNKVTQEQVENNRTRLKKMQSETVDTTERSDGPLDIDEKSEAADPTNSEVPEHFAIFTVDILLIVE